MGVEMADVVNPQDGVVIDPGGEGDAGELVEFRRPVDHKRNLVQPSRAKTEPDPETYPDGSPVRRNKHGVVLKQYARTGGRPPLEYDPKYHPKQSYEFALLGLPEYKMADINARKY
jgi:hypothetical protein